jgi:hypothetical protein
VDFTIVAAIGAFVGASEIVAAYRDDPMAALVNPGALVYLAVNAVASMGALALIRAVGLTLNAPGGAQRATQLVAAGFGAMVLFRSSLQIRGADGQKTGIGPGTFLQIMLDAAMRSVDRARGRSRAASIGGIVEGISLAMASDLLVPFCLALLQHARKEDQKALGDQVGPLLKLKDNEQLAVMNIGLALMSFVGPNLLTAAATAVKRVAAVPGPASETSDADGPPAVAS